MRWLFAFSVMVGNGELRAQSEPPRHSPWQIDFGAGYGFRRHAFSPIREAGPESHSGYAVSAGASYAFRRHVRAGSSLGYWKAIDLIDSPRQRSVNFSTYVGRKFATQGAYANVLAGFSVDRADPESLRARSLDYGIEIGIGSPRAVRRQWTVRASFTKSMWGRWRNESEPHVKSGNFRGTLMTAGLGLRIP